MNVLLELVIAEHHQWTEQQFRTFLPEASFAFFARSYLYGEPAEFIFLEEIIDRSFPIDIDRHIVFPFGLFLLLEFDEELLEAFPETRQEVFFHESEVDTQIMFLI